MNKSFGEWLQEELNDRHLSQKEFSAISGITQSQISRIISGERGAAEKTILAIAKGLNLTPEFVFRKAGLLPQKLKVSQQTEEIIFLLEQLSQNEREEIEDLIRVKISRKRAGDKKKPALSILKDKVEQ